MTLPRADFERCVRAVDRSLTARGFRLVREVYEHATFGSAYAEWRRGDARLRVIWDGKERWLVADSSDAGLLGEPVRVEREAEAAAAVEACEESVRRYASR